MYLCKHHCNASGRTAAAAALLILAATSLGAGSAVAVTVDWVTVGDAGNAVDSTGYGAVGYEFKIGTYEFTNSQYVFFLNNSAAGKLGAYGVYNASMGSDSRGGITRTGTAGNYSYSTRANMASKPVNFVNWFDAARVSNWLHNGANSGADTETGAYSLNGTTSGVVSRNAGARFWIPTENEWYKAAFYVGGSLGAGYWRFPTQSNTLGTAYAPDSRGNGDPRAINQSVANYNDFMDWGLPTDGYGNVTTVGLNGAPSAYGTFDMAGNVYEMTDTLDSGSRIIRGGAYFSPAGPLFQTHVSRDGRETGGITEGSGLGFRLAAAPVPEPSTYAMALAGLACGGFSMWRRRKRACRTPSQRDSKTCVSVSAHRSPGQCL